MVSNSYGARINRLRGAAFLNPIAGAAAVIWLIAWYAVVLGILGIFFGFRLRSLRTLAP